MNEVIKRKFGDEDISVSARAAAIFDDVEKMKVERDVAVKALNEANARLAQFEMAFAALQSENTMGKVKLENHAIRLATLTEKLSAITKILVEDR